MKRLIGRGLYLGLVLFSFATAMAAEPAAEKTVEVVEEKPLISEETLGRLDDLVKRVDLKVNIDEGYVSKNFGINGRWERKIEPSYQMGNTTLIDDYTLTINANPTSLAHSNEDGASIGLAGQSIVKALFARQFPGNSAKDHLKTLVETPYTPFTHLPRTAEKARSRLVEGDYVIFQSYLHLLVNAAQFKAVTGHFPLSISAYYLVSGEFQVHVSRVEGNKFRLKMFAVRGSNKAINFRLGYEPGELNIAKVSFIDNFIERKFRIAPLEFYLGVPRSNLFMLDYVLNFDDPEVVKAYDELISSLWKLKTLKVLNPFQTREELKNVLLANVSRFEELYEKDKDKGIEDRTTDRMFRGANDVFGGNYSIFNIGFDFLAKKSFNATYTENLISAVDSAGRNRYFYMPTYTIIDNNKFLFNLFSEEMQRSANLLFETSPVTVKKKLIGDDYQFNIESFGELSFYFDYRDRYFDSGEIREFKDLIRKRVPEEIYSQIDWKDWVDERRRVNARVTSLMVFRPRALDWAAELDGQIIYQELLRYLKSLPKIVALPESNSSDEGQRWGMDIESKYAKELEQITRSLAVVFNTGLGYGGRERAEAFSSLRGNQLFNEVGPGFLIHILTSEAKRRKSDEGIKDLLGQIYYETTWTGKGSDTVHFIYGSCRNRRLYKAVMTIYSVLNSRGIDLRLIDDSDLPHLPGKAKDPECEDQGAALPARAP